MNTDKFCSKENRGNAQFVGCLLVTATALTMTCGTAALLLKGCTNDKTQSLPNREKVFSKKYSLNCNGHKEYTYE